MAKKIGQRLDDLKAADNLEVFNHLPGRFYLLHGKLLGQFSLDLEHPNRLVFETG